MRIWTAALTVCTALLALAACGTVNAQAAAPKPGARLALPDTLARSNRICRWSESTGNPAPMPPPDASQRHKHVSIVNWKLREKETWFRFYPRKGSQTKFNAELSYGEIINPDAVYNDLELIDFRAVNSGKAPVEVKLDETAEQLCDEPAPSTPGDYYDGPFLLSVSPLANAEATDISEHVLVYAPLEMQLKDGPHDWFVLMIWHVRTAEECAQLTDPVDKTSCLAILDIANLETGDYSTKAPDLFRKVKYPYVPSATQSHNGVIHGPP
ncbi:MAG TPA: hypothetical protein VMF52_04795 [Steroidobacteraceae bacterium]|nr:hypothetical protein [Steroidobacteraceae bacterium]